MATKLGINNNDEAVSSRALKNSQTRLKNNTDISSKLGEEALSFKGLPALLKEYLEFNKSFTFQDWKRFRGQVGDELGKAIAHNNGSNIKD